jgi:hypothetical protein
MALIPQFPEMKFFLPRKRKKRAGGFASMSEIERESLS